MAIYAYLKGEQPAPWSADTALRARRRALHAMHVLVQIRATRRHLALGADNARLAAHAALLAGLYASDSAVLAIENGSTGKRGGKVLTEHQHAEAQ